MNTTESTTNVEFVPFAHTNAVKRGDVPADAAGLRVYEAEYRESYEAPASLGLYTTREGAELACARAHFPYGRGRFRVCERVLVGAP
jgi:hypothetical protein